MSLIVVIVVIALAVVSLVVYSALVVSSQQERLAQRIQTDNHSPRVPHHPYTAASNFAFETADELTGSNEIETENDVLAT